MTIYYIGNFDNKYSTEQYIFECLLSQGYDVTAVQEDMLTSKQHLELSEGYDLLLFAKGRVKDGVEGLEFLLNNFKGKKAFWLFDKMYDFRPERAEWMDRIIPLVDIYFITDGSAKEHYNKFKTPYKILRQGGMKPYYGRVKREFQQYQVAFLGALYTDERKKMLEAVDKRYKLIIGGTKDMYQFRGQQLADLCASVPVVLADVLTYRDGDKIKTYKDYWSNRIYELLSCGALLVHPYIQDKDFWNEFGKDGNFLFDEYFIGYEIGNLDHMFKKIDEALTMPELARKEMQNKGRELVCGKLSYNNRVRSMMRHIYSTYAL